ncbi:MAG TPA: ABC transporter substrate-binding protein [Reyranella sp.]|nr:ABC transporter substrate-binding protein [Reyranella sp.]
MVRHIAQVATLGFALIFAASGALRAQDQKGTLVFAVESLGAQTLDPILEGRPGNAVYQAAMYDALVGFNLAKGGIGPGVAERWELSPDGLAWTFHIRPGQTFHNGDKLTAHDVKFSLERQMSPNSLASAAASMRRIIKNIEVVDDVTVKVHTAGPQIGLPASLSRAVAPEGAIMPKAYIEKVGEEEFRKKPIGSGPWKFVRNVPGDRIEFTAVDTPHWRGRPHFKDLQVLLVPEESTRVAMVRTGEAAIASIGPETMLGAARAGLEILSVPGTMQAIFQFWGTWKPELKDSPLAKPRVRQALSLAVDRKQVIEHVMNGKARLPYPFATFGYTDYYSADRWEKWAADAYRYDPALAKKILAEEGYPKGFELKFANTALPGTQYMVDIGTAIADMWTKIGVKVTLKHYEWGAFAPMERGDQAGLIGWASMYRTAGRPDAQWRYDGAFSPESFQRLLGDKENCSEACQDFVKTYRALLAEVDTARRTALTDHMVELVANSWTVVPILEGMGYYAINTKKVGQFDAIPGRHELGDVFERVPRPDEKPWKK